MASLTTPADKGSPGIWTAWEDAKKAYEKATGREITSLPRVENIEDLLKSIEDREQSWIRWRHDGSKINALRDLARDSLKPVDKISEVVGYAATGAFPPSVAIFSVVHSLITVTSDVTEDYNIVSDFFQELHLQLVQFIIIDEFTKTIPELQTALVSLLESLIFLCGRCAKYIDMKRTKKFVKTLAGQDEKLNQAYKRFRRTVEHINGIVGKASLAAIVKLREDVTAGNKEILADVRSIHNLIKDQAENADNNENRRILDSLSTLDFGAKQTDVFASSQDGTGTWFLRTQEFQEWFEGDSNCTLWGCGTAGVGKTVLTSIAVNHALRATTEKRFAIVYIYCEHNNPQTLSHLELLGSVARQLAEQTWPLTQAVKDFRAKNAEKLRHPTQDEWVALILSLCRLFSRTYIFMDSLDACPNSSRNDLLTQMKEVQSHVRFFFTSLPHVTLPVELNRLSKVFISASESDLETYLKFRIDRDENLTMLIRSNPQLKIDIIKSLKERANGQFLIARLQMNQLCEAPTLRAVKVSLQTCPTEIFQFYDRSMERIEQQTVTSRNLAKQTLNFIFQAKRPLKSEELRTALAVDENDTALDQDALPELRTLLIICVDLIKIDEVSQLVTFTHPTLNEYFKEKTEMLQPISDTDIAMRCLTYLSFEDFASGPCEDSEALKERLQQHQFFEYSSLNWGYHAKQAGSTLMDSIINYLNEDEKLSSSIQVLNAAPFRAKSWHNAHPTDFGPLHVGSYWGLKDVVIHFIDDGLDVNAQDSTGATPLLIAAAHGNHETVEILMANGADFNIPNDKSQTALYWAARNGHSTVLDKILQKRDQEHEIKLIPDNDGWTAMNWAVVNGNYRMVQRLLRSNIAARPTDAQLNGTLVIAATKGHDKIVELLLKMGADVNIQWVALSTPLDFAICMGHESTVRTLLRAKASVSLKDEQGNSALHWAISHKPIARMLLQGGADVRARNNMGQTSLCWTANDGSIEVATLLMDYGADINAQDNCGVTPLHRASLRGSESMVRLLLHEGANPNTEDEDGWTPLHCAFLKGNKDVVKILAEKTESAKGILELMEQKQQDPIEKARLDWIMGIKREASTLVTGLRLAATERQLGRMEMMLENGADIDGKDHGGYTALEIGIWMGFKDVVQLLLDFNANVNLRGSYARPPLYWAIDQYREELVPLLLNHGADVNASTYGSYPLLQAAEVGNSTIVKLLLDSGADMDLRDPSGQNALHIASRTGNSDIVRLLAKIPMNLDIGDSQGRTALILAVEHLQHATAALLLECGAATEPHVMDGSTALHLAVLHGDLAMTKIILDNDANIQASTRYGFTALHLAAFLGNRAMIDLLLERGADPATTVAWSEDQSSIAPDEASTKISANNYQFHKLAVEKEVDRADFTALRGLTHEKIVSSARHEAPENAE